MAKFLFYPAERKAPHVATVIPRRSRTYVKRYWILTGLMLAFFLAAFGILSALRIPFLENPSIWMDGRDGATAAAIGVGLLIADVFLPVPSSLVMIAHGAIFGVAKGALLSLAGGVGATLFGFAVGRRGGGLIARLVSDAEKARADALLRRWGALAILITRPIPLMAETVSILAGASPMGWGRMTLAAVAGSAPAALMYALTGASAKGFDNGFLMFGAVLAIAGLFWAVSRRAGREVEVQARPRAR